MKKQPELTEQTRQCFLDAFWSLYAQKPLEAISVKEIAAKAGYNRGTFYEYFSDIRQCLDAIEDMALPSFDELPPAPGVDARPPELLESFIAQYRRRLEYYDVLLGERGDPSFQRKLIDSIKATVKSRMPDLPAMPENELDCLLEYTLAGMIGVMRYYLHRRPREPQARVMELMYRIMGDRTLDSLRNRPA